MYQICKKYLFILFFTFLFFGILSEDLTENVKSINKAGESLTHVEEVPHTFETDDHNAEELFREGLQLLHKSGREEPLIKLAYKYLEKAAARNHTGALESVALGALLGEGVSQSISRALAIFRRLADEGSPRGQFGLWFLQSVGLTFSTNDSQAEALLYLTVAAAGGDGLAEVALGYRHLLGLGVPEDCERSLVLYKRAATKVVAEGRLRGLRVDLGVRLGQDGKEEEKHTILLRDDRLHYYHYLADGGDESAQVGLGQLYYEGGRGINIDDEKAFRYLKKASLYGNSNAMAFLGQIYLEGSEVVVADNETALAYFRKSVAAGNPLGMSGLGRMYLHGNGVAIDNEMAFKYFSGSADQGVAEGQLQLGLMYSEGIFVRTDHKAAIKYLGLAAQQGNLIASFNLALIHSSGAPGVPRSCRIATKLFKTVVEGGLWSERVMESARRALERGRLREAILRYTLLAEMGIEVAQSNLAFMLEQEVTASMFTPEERRKRALVQWERSARQGHLPSRMRLGDCHFYGLGTEVDLQKAVMHYRQASEKQGSPQAMFNLGYMHEWGLGTTRDIHLARRFYDMAAHASEDAQLPVKLVLVRLRIAFLLESLLGDSGLSLLNPAFSLGLYWDFGVVGGLIGLLVVLVVLHRHTARRIRALL